MKNVKRFLLLGIIVALLIPIFGFGEKKYDEKDLLVGILEEVGANFQEGDINMGGTIIDRFVSIEEIEDMAVTIRSLLEIKGESLLDENMEGIDKEGDYYYQNLITEEGFIQLIVQGYDKHDNLVTFTLSSYDDIDEGVGETCLFINLIKRVQFVEINGIIEKVESFFKQYDKLMNVTTCIVGTFDGDIDLNDKEKTILNTTKLIKGKVVEKYNDGDALSFTIYTPYIEEHIYTGDKKMNLNIAVRYNEYEDKTYIWIGTPIITIGY